MITWWTISPALLILIFPLGFRMTCYYYRKAYYRSFWLAPPACAVSDATAPTPVSRGSLSCSRTCTATSSTSASSSTSSSPSTRSPPSASPASGLGFSVGHRRAHRERGPAVALLAELPRLPAPLRRRGQAVLGGADPPPDLEGAHPAQREHMVFAWMSLVFVAFTDLYVRLVASGTIHDYGFHF